MDSDKLAVLNVCIEAGLPVLLWGEPGTGKTSIIESMSASLERVCETVIASLRDPADFAGLPVVRPEGVTMHAPAWARRIAAAKRAVLLLDEVNQCPPATQGALMRVVLDGEVGDLGLRSAGCDVAIVAAANPPKIGAGAYDLAHPLANRFVHIAWEHDVEAWCRGLLAGFPNVSARRLPEDWERFLPEISAFIVGFLRKNPSLAQQMPREDEEVRAYPTLRSWHMFAARGLAAARAMGYGLETQVAQLLLVGAVGDGAAVAFLQYARQMDLPDPEEAIANPDKFKVPSRNDVQAVFAAAVTAAALAKRDDEDVLAQRFLGGWKALCRLPPDIAYVSAHQLMAARPRKASIPNMGPFRQLLAAAGLI